MQATLYEVDGTERLLVGDSDPEDAEEVIASTALGVDAGDAFELLTGHDVGDAAVPTIEEVTNAFDPWLAWYGGTEEGYHAVVYGPRGDHDRKVSFAPVDDDYEVTLEFGRVADVPDRAFDAAAVPPVVVRTGSKLRAKRLFHDFCDVR